jgi:hypothetical protein
LWKSRLSIINKFQKLWLIKYMIVKNSNCSGNPSYIWFKKSLIIKFILNGCQSFDSHWSHHPINLLRLLKILLINRPHSHRPPLDQSIASYHRLNFTQSLYSRQFGVRRWKINKLNCLSLCFPWKIRHVH